MSFRRLMVTLTLSTTLFASCDAAETTSPEDALRKEAASVGAYALEPQDPQPEALVELGQALFFDPELSGNRDISCATCHHPRFATVDGLRLGAGTGGTGLGPERLVGEKRDIIPRNSPDLFNRSDPEWRTMFWDLRILASSEGVITSPAGGYLPRDARTMFAAQAMFPVTSRDEMRGALHDVDVNGEPNELAPIYGSQPRKMWDALMTRLRAIDGYRTLFEKAFPDTPVEDLGFDDAAMAMSAFQREAFHLTDSPWDDFLRGNDSAMSPAAQRGAALFFGDAGCARCHNGRLLSDQLAHNIGVPQIGPGKDAAAPMDVGFRVETGRESDAFAFRTPPLRNVELTGPYMHNGAYDTLEDAVRHHLDPRAAHEAYDQSKLPANLVGSWCNSPEQVSRLFSTLSGKVRPKRPLEDQEVDDLLAFLHALTSPSAQPEELEKWIPESVPSGLDFDR